MQVGTYPTRNFAHTILIFRSGMDFLFIQFAHMRYNLLSWIPNVKSLRIPKILVSCGLSNLLHFYCIHSMHTTYLCASLPHTHISQRFWFPADYPIKVSAYMFALCNHVYCILVSRALRSFPHTVGWYTLVLQQEEASLLTLGRL